MRNGFYYSIKNLSREQALYVAYFFLQVTSNWECIYDNNYPEDLYKALVDVLNLKEHSSRIIQAVINHHIKNNKLTPVDPDSKKTNPYEMKGKLKKYYKEDQNIYDSSDCWDSGNEDDIALIRAVFADETKWLSHIIALTFFTTPESSLAKIELPDVMDEDIVDESYLETIFSPKTDCARFMSEAFKLSELEGKILTLTYLIACVKEFNYFCNSELYDTDLRFYTALAKAFNSTMLEIRSCFRKDRKLLSFDLIAKNGEISDDAKRCIYYGNIDSLFNDILKMDDKNDYYSLDSFPVKEEETSLASRLLKNDNSTNLLLYGAPGAGKTQFARALVHSIGLKPLIFKNELEVENDDSENKAICRLNSLLSIKKSDSVIIIDEAEGVLKTRGSFFGIPVSLPQKGIVNKMLEESQNKVIWILNYTNELDESTRRRFTYSIKFNELSQNMLKTIADSKLNTISMSPDLHSKLVDLCGKFQVTGASVDNMIKTVSGMDLEHTDENQIVSDVQKVIESNSTLIYGKKKMRDKVCSDYDLSVLNTSIPADEIIQMVMNAREFAEKNNGTEKAGIRMLFYGLSGTGKTELARYIAEKLGKKILLKRASDILGPYVGQNEENIKEAFEEAESSGDILLFDEADSFFADRENATHSWERTTVNEFLTQMEEFSGILICTTNLKQIMDKAMQRRFHIITEFNPLTQEGIVKLLNRFFRAYTFDDNLISPLLKYKTVTPGDFGSLTGKIRFMPQTKITPSLIIQELCSLQEEKESRRQRIGFAG